MIIKCEICNKERRFYPADIKRGGGRFCSHKCHGIWQSLNLKKENSPTWKGGPKLIKKICQICKKDFFTIHNKSIFCSSSCFGKHISNLYKNKHHSTWKGGESSSAKRYILKHPDRLIIYQFIQRAKRIGIILRGNCEICGEFNTDAHHPDYSKPLYIKWLCKRHHAKLHKGTINLPVSSFAE